MRRTLLSLLLAAVGTPAYAADAKAVWVDPSCRCFIADLGGEFGSHTWRSGQPPSDGDVMEGNVTAEGLVELANKTRGYTNAVYVMALSPTVHSLIHSSPADCKRRWKGRGQVEHLARIRKSMASILVRSSTRYQWTGH